jgi:hypothetical protein
MSEAPQEEAKVQDSKVFNMSEVEGEEDLRDAWGRASADDEQVNFEESRYTGETVPALKEELKRRRDAGREFDTSSIRTKRDLVAALEADDRAQATASADEE